MLRYATYVLLLQRAVVATRSDTHWNCVDVRKKDQPVFVHPSIVQYVVPKTAGGAIAFSWNSQKLYQESIPGDFSFVPSHVQRVSEVFFRGLQPFANAQEPSVDVPNINIVNIQQGDMCIASITLSNRQLLLHGSAIKQFVTQLHDDLQNLILVNSNQRLSALGDFNTPFEQLTAGLAYPLRPQSLNSSASSLRINSATVVYREAYPVVYMRATIPNDGLRFNPSFSRFFDWSRLFISTMSEVDDFPSMYANDVVLGNPFNAVLNNLHGQRIHYMISNDGSITINCVHLGVESLKVHHRDDMFARNFVYLLHDDRGFWRVNWAGVKTVCQSLYT